MAKTIIKVTPTKAVVKITDADATIALATDLLFTGQTVSGIPKVYITGIKYSNNASGKVIITRNAVKVCTLSYADSFSFETYSLTENAISDIVVTCPVDSFVILELSKTDGYSDITPNIGA